jgi:hypothetical protein
MDYGRDHLDKVVESALGRYRFDRAGLTRYFARLSYDFTAEYREGLSRFYELAYEAGELEEVPRLRFIDEVAAGGGAAVGGGGAVGGAGGGAAPAPRGAEGAKAPEAAAHEVAASPEAAS